MHISVRWGKSTAKDLIQAWAAAISGASLVSSHPSFSGSLAWRHYLSHFLAGFYFLTGKSVV